jgi:hypothetical protein
MVSVIKRAARDEMWAGYVREAPEEMKDEKDQLQDDGMTRYSRCAACRERPTQAPVGD